MKKIVFVAIGVLLVGTSAFAAKMQGPVHKEECSVVGPKIRVLLAKNVGSALIEAKGPYRVVQRDSQEVMSGGMVGKRYPMHAIQGGLRWGEEYPGVSHVTLVPGSRQTTFFVNGFQYCGLIEVYLDRDHQISVINEVPIEDYVRSTVALEVTDEMNPEALAAYIIAARTEAYVISLSGQKSERLWDVKARDVGYFGNGVALQRNGVEEGVEATRFMVLETAKGNEPIRIQPKKLEELADSGLNAKQMLQKCFPHSRLNVTAHPNAKIIR